jgi:hypothetical protein
VNRDQAIEVLALLRARLATYAPEAVVWVEPLYMTSGDMTLTNAELADAQRALGVLGARQLTPRMLGSRVGVGNVGTVADLLDEALIELDPLAPARRSPGPLAAFLRIFWIS